MTPSADFLKPQALVEDPDVDPSFFAKRLTNHTLRNFYPLHKSAVIEMMRYHGPLQDMEQMRSVCLLNEEEYERRTQKLQAIFVRLSYAERAVNELKLQMFAGGFSSERPLIEQPFPAQLSAVFEDPVNADHGRSHEAIFRQLLKTTLAYLYNSEQTFDEELILAAYLTTPHDIGQIDAIHRNYYGLHDLGDGKKLTVKAGHAEVGGLYPELYRNEIIEAGLLQEVSGDEKSKERVRRITAIANIIMMIHDEPERAMARLRAVEHQAYRIENNLIVSCSNDDVYQWYKDGTLDLFTTSPSQRLYIAQQKRTEAGFATKGSQWGFHPELEKMKKDDFLRIDSDHRPSFVDADSVFRMNVETIGAVFYFADLAAMLYPSNETVCRKLQVQRSAGRVVFSDNEGIQARIFGTSGENLSSDWERAMFESRMILELLKDTPLAQNSEFTQVVVKTVLKSAWMTHRYYLNLMENLGKGEMQITETYKNRIFMYLEKLLRYEKLDTQLVETVRAKIDGGTSVSEILTIIQEQLDTAQSKQRKLLTKQSKQRKKERIVAKLTRVSNELTHVLAMYKNKPLPQTNRAEKGAYTSQEMDRCEQAFTEFIVEIMKKERIEVPQDLMQWFHAISDDDMLPVKQGGDSSGVVFDAHVVRRKYRLLPGAQFD